MWMLSPLVRQKMWDITTGERERKRLTERRRVRGRRKITERETSLTLENTQYGRWSRSHGILSGFLLVVAVYLNMAGMWNRLQRDEIRRDCCWSQRWALVWAEKSLYNSNEERSSGFRLLTEDSNMPEVNYLLSVSWGYIKVCLWVTNRRTQFSMYWLFNLDVA